MFSSQNSQVSNAANYIEDVFSTYLYTGTGASQTITNGIDLSTNGGLVWQKDRSQGTGYHHILQDTARGATNCLFTNLTNAQSQDSAGTGFVFNNNGFTIGSTNVKVNASGDNYVSWTFRKQPKFFDVVTWTGNGTGTRTISHSLGSVPGAITMKALVANGGVNDWPVYHRSTGASNLTFLNLTAAAGGDSSFASTDPTSTNFTVSTFFNVNGNTYVAYLFAHNAGGFGLTGTDNVISCGSFTGGSNVVVNLGYEPQWLLVKKTNAAQNWFMMDNMRGLTANQGDVALSPNISNAEPTASGNFNITSTGFVNAGLGAGTDTYIYIAIRRGPMKVPTDATKVFAPVKQAGGGTVTTNFPVDLGINTKPSGVFNKSVVDRLRGVSTTSYPYLLTETTAAEVAGSGYGFGFDNNTGYKDNAVYGGTETPIYWNFRRAPSFFDEVCSPSFVDGTLINHNLGVTPELIIVKTRGVASNWMGAVNDSGNIRNLSVNTTSGGYLPSLVYSSYFNATTIDPAGIKNGGGGSAKGDPLPVVAYLFATCAGVSKVGSYTGTGATQTISCGFTGGARFVMIKRTDSTGDWYVWDTARGMVSGTDPSLLLNSTAAEVNANSIYTTTGGFQIVSTAAGINSSGGTYIFLAIA
jgi:hypothetical protein